MNLTLTHRLKDCAQRLRHLSADAAILLAGEFLLINALYVSHTGTGMIIAALCCALAAFSFGLDKASILILSLATGIFWWWFKHTQFNNYAIDIEGHTEYIRYVAEHFSLPRPDASWEFYHPPLYYIIAGLMHAVLVAAGETDPLQIIRFFSLLCFIVVLIYAARTLKLASLPHALYVLCLCMVAFWPSGIMIATRVDSHALFYPLAMISFYHLVRWHEDRATKTLAAAMIFLGFAVMTRTNSIVIAGVMACLVLYHLVGKRVSLRTFFDKRILLCGLLLLLALGVNTGRAVYLNLQENKPYPFLVGNSQILMEKPELRVPNDVESLLGFALAEYLDPNFVDKMQDPGGRRNFWVSLLKTSLWGEFTFVQAGYAKAANILLLFMAAYLIVPIFFYSRQQFDERLPHLLLLGLSIGALFYNRYTLPVFSSGDFRYCYLMIVPVAYLLGKHFADLWQRRAFIPCGIGGLIVLSVVVLGDLVYLLQF